MYAFPEMLKMTKVEFPTGAHKIVAENILIGNGRYFTLDTLTEGAKIIADIPEDRIKLVTAGELYDLGIMLP